MSPIQLLLKWTVGLPGFALEKLGIADRRAIKWGAGLALLGLAVVGTGPSDAGAAITLLGLYTLVLGIHQFGRLGPDEASGAR